MTEVSDKLALRENAGLPVVFTATGVAAAFGLASCCAIPLLLYTLGIGTTAWLARIGIVSMQYRDLLTYAAVAGLGAGGFLLWRQWRARSCLPDSLCARPWVRLTTATALLVGWALLYYGYTSV